MDLDTFDGLPAFLTVGRLRSFTNAASELGVTPTAVSQKIKSLERRLGIVLFQRTTRHVALTEAGTALFARLGPVAAEVDDALATLEPYRGRPMGTLRITAPRTAGHIIGPLVTQLRRAYAELSVEVSLDDAFVDLVAAGFDVGVRLGDSVEKDMIRIPLTKESAWSIVGSPDYFAKHGRPQTPEDLIKHQAIRQRMVKSGAIYRWDLQQRGRDITVDVAGGVIVNDVDLMVALACDGLGLAYLADDGIAAQLNEKRLERVLAKYIRKGPGLYLFFPERTQTQPKLRALVDLVTKPRAKRGG